MELADESQVNGAQFKSTISATTIGSHDATSTDVGGRPLVLESKGSWLHAGYHLTSATVGPALLSLPYAFTLIGWVPGIIALLLGAGTSFYAYYVLISQIEHLELQGKRFIRFRDLADHVIGSKWSLYLIAPLQFTVCFVTVIAAILVGGVCMKEIYVIYDATGTMKLYQFIAVFGVIAAALSQLPSFHSLRHVNLLSLLLCLGYSLCATCGSFISGLSPNAPHKAYGVTGDLVHKAFGVFGSLAIIANTFGNAIIAEIQATIAPPVTGKMMKGLCLCYIVAVSTFISVAVSGYWAFGNAAKSNIFDSMSPVNGVHLVPRTLLVTAYAFVFLQLLAISVVYLQPAFEVLESRFADIDKGRFSMRNLLPRLLARSVFVGLATFFAAMLPFFGDINALMGALGYTPLVFVFPLIFYNILFKLPKRSFKYWLNLGLIILFSLLTLLGSLAALGQLVLDAKKYRVFANNAL